MMVVVMSPLLTPCRVRGTMVMLFRGRLVLVRWFHQSQARGHQDAGHKADREAQTVMRVETNLRQDVVMATCNPLRSVFVSGCP